MLQMNNINVRNVLLDLNLAVNKHEFVLIMGDNGAGKTTLFNTISGHTYPQSGTITIDGCDVTNLPQHTRSKVVSNVFQDPKSGTIGTMTIRENLNMSYMRGKPRRLTIANSAQRDDFYRERLKILNMNLENRLNDCAGDLSGGQRQALSIVMAMVADSKLLLLDEITAALDAKSSENILRIVKESIQGEKRTCIMITHDVKHADLFDCQLLTLHKGRLLARSV